jgi:hypothetical protein
MARKYTDFLDQQILNKYIKDSEIPAPEGIGNPANLNTTSKDNLVNAVNELKSELTTHNHNTSYLGITAKATDSDKLNGQVASFYATADHNHTLNISDIDNLQASLDNKSDSTHNHNTIYYTQDQVNNLISGVVSQIDWKEAVNNFSDLATTYPTPDEGWTCSVNNEDTVYRYNGSNWVILANGTVPLATISNDGKMSSTDKSKLDGIENNATADQTASEILDLIKTVDGTGSNLDADKLDGHDSSYFSTVDHNHNTTYLGITAKAADSSKLNNATESITNINNTIVKRGASGQVNTGNLAVTGTITATGDITAYFSDMRLKNKLNDIDNALDNLCTLSGFVYSPNELAQSFGFDSSKVEYGLSAQEVESVFPELVSLAPFDYDENENSKSGENYKTLDYVRLVPVLVEAIKELKSEIDNIKSMIRS